MKKLFNSFWVLFFPLFVTSCVTSYKQVEVQEVQNVKLLNMTDSTADLEVTMKITNPNKYDIKVKDYDLEAFINKKPVGKVKLADNVKMKRKSEDTYVMILNADMTRVNKLLPTMAFTDKALIGLKGNLKVRARGINKKIDIDLTEKVSIKEFKNASWAKENGDINMTPQ
ncbi:MAG: hypothetical protein K2X86_09700 [Cytophagaceae bacterium]|nr:hypothetical protein [Cytophagaceae bacterium]